MAKAYKTEPKQKWEDFPFDFSDPVLSDLQDVDWMSPDFDEAIDMFAADFPTENIKSVKWINKATKRVSVNGVNYTLYDENNGDCC